MALISIPLSWVPVLLLVTIGFGYFIVAKLRGTPQLTIVDIPLFLRKIDVQAYMTDLNPIAEEILRSTFSWLTFRRLQRERLHRMHEILSCMSHDAFVFICLANTALWIETREHPGMEESEKYIALAQELHSAAVEFRIYSSLALLRINFWLILRTQWWFPLPSPNSSNLSSVAGFAFHSCYRRFKAAVAAMCLQYDQEFHDEIAPLI
jgi:hypothetical protein